MSRYLHHPKGLIHVFGHRSARRARVGTLTAAVLAVALVGCEGGGDSSEGSGAAGKTGPETSTLKIGVIPIAGVTPIFAAQKLGYFQEEGLTVTLETSSGGAASLPLVAQGGLQISNAPPVSVVLANTQRFDFAMLGPSLDGEATSPGQTAVLASKSSGITKLSDLQGKKVAVNTINSVNWLYNRALLEKAGVDLKTVTYLEVPFPSMIDALTNGSVDAIDVPQPFFFIAEQTGKVLTLGYTFSDVQPSVPITAYAATQDFVDDNPRTIAAFERAMTRAVEYMRANESEAKKLVAEYTGAKPELVAQIPLNKWSTELSVEGIQKTADLMRKEGLIKEEVDVKDFIPQIDAKR